MMKPDFSKAAMQKFFLYHTEKLIIVVALIAMAAFFWIGFGIKPYSDKSPDELVKLAKEAERYIDSETSWDEIKSYRTGRKNVDQIVRDGSKVDASIYEVDPFTGIAARTLDARLDPSIFGIIEPEAVVFTAPLLVDIGATVDLFAAYPTAPSDGLDETDTAWAGLTPVLVSVAMTEEKKNQAEAKKTISDSAVEEVRQEDSVKASQKTKTK